MNARRLCRAALPVQFLVSAAAHPVRANCSSARRPAVTRALAITDECSLAGIVRALEASRDNRSEADRRREFQLHDGPEARAAVRHPGRLHRACARCITRGRRASRKGSYRLTCADLADGLPGTLALWLPDADGRYRAMAAGCAPRLATALGWRWNCIAARTTRSACASCKRWRARWICRWSPRAMCTCTCAVGWRCSTRSPRSAIACRLPQAGALIFRNGERHLRRRQALAAIYPAPLLQAETLRLAARCQFTPGRVALSLSARTGTGRPHAATGCASSRRKACAGAGRTACHQTVREQIEHELALIAELQYESYFLTVHDIVRFARSQHILCQGRGSAANSAVCFALGITEVDPARMNLLVERFISKERNEPPDIDVDFEHERREEVIQYIYGKYGRERAALAATVIRYRARSAVRDVASALGLPLDQVDQLSHGVSSTVEACWHAGCALARARLRSATVRCIAARADADRELLGMPRHLSQHVGGFVISDAPAARAGAGGKRGDARTHDHPVGQGRSGHDEACSRSIAWRWAC